MPVLNELNFTKPLYSSEFVKKHRKMSKEIRELDYKIREEEQIAAQAAMSRGR